MHSAVLSDSSRASIWHRRFEKIGALKGSDVILPPGAQRLSVKVAGETVVLASAGFSRRLARLEDEWLVVGVDRQRRAFLLEDVAFLETH